MGRGEKTPWCNLSRWLWSKASKLDFKELEKHFCLWWDNKRLMKSPKMLGANWFIFASGLTLELDAKSLVLHSGPKLLCFVVHLYKYFWFWYQTEIVSKKVYAMIWLFLEIISLKYFDSFLWYFLQEAYLSGCLKTPSCLW